MKSLRIFHWTLIRALSCIRWLVADRPLTEEAHVPSQANTFEYCGLRNVTETNFPQNTLVFCCQYHSGNAAYLFTHLSM
jgi:hypothetical protein